MRGWEDWQEPPPPPPPHLLTSTSTATFPPTSVSKWSHLSWFSSDPLHSSAACCNYLRGIRATAVYNYFTSQSQNHLHWLTSPTDLYISSLLNSLGRNNGILIGLFRKVQPQSQRVLTDYWAYGNKVMKTGWKTTGWWISVAKMRKSTQQSFEASHEKLYKVEGE